MPDQQAQALGCGRHLERVGIGVHALGELDAEALHALGHQHRGQLGRSALARFVAVIGNQHALHSVSFERGQQFIGEAFHPIGGGDVAIPGTPEGQGIHDGLAQNDFFAGLQCRQVEHAPATRIVCRQVHVQGCAGAQARRDLAPVQLAYATGIVKHRNHHRAIEVLVA